MSKSLANLNGVLLPAQDAKVHLLDRGFLYGDSLYEVIRTYNQQPFCLNEHIDRLKNSAKLAKMQLTHSVSEIADQARRTVAEFARTIDPQTEIYCRIMISRGYGMIGFGLECLESKNQLAIVAQPIIPMTDAQFEKGARLCISNRLRNDPRALDPAMKSGNYLNSLLAYLEAKEKGFDDALFVNHHGFLTEGTTFNFFYIKDHFLVTPPLDSGILHGITRKILLRIAEQMGLRNREVDFDPERLRSADEAFMASTVREVFPITLIDSTKMSGGRPGPWTRKLSRAFQDFVRTQKP